MKRAWVDFRDRYVRERRIAAVGDLVARVVERHHLTADLNELRLFAEWPQLVGERIGARTRPQSIWDRVLVVEVATSAWLHELRLMRPKIVADLLDTLGLPRPFDDIRFVLAKDNRAAEPRPHIRRPRAIPVRLAAVPASAGERDRIVREAACIADPELRELVARVRITHNQ